MSFKNTNPDNWHTIYQELALLLGKENALKIYEAYQGQYVNFPMKLFSKEGLENTVRKEYNGRNTKQLARKYGYSVRHLNRILKNITDTNLS